MQQFSSLLSWRLFTAQRVSGVFPPIIRSSMTAVAASGFTFISWWQSCCFRVRAGYVIGPTSVVGRGRYHHVPTVNQRRLLQLISSWWWAWGCPKHVELYLNDRHNKAERLMHLVGWFIWIVRWCTGLQTLNLLKLWFPYQFCREDLPQFSANTTTKIVPPCLQRALGNFFHW